MSDTCPPPARFIPFVCFQTSYSVFYPKANNRLKRPIHCFIHVLLLHSSSSCTKYEEYRKNRRQTFRNKVLV